MTFHETIVQGTFDANLKNRVQWWTYKASVGFTLPGLAGDSA